MRKVCNKYSVVIFLLLQYAPTDLPGREETSLRQGFFWRGGGGARAPPSDFFEISRGGAPPLVPPREIRRGGRGGAEW